MASERAWEEQVYQFIDPKWDTRPLNGACEGLGSWDEEANEWRDCGEPARMYTNDELTYEPHRLCDGHRSRFLYVHLSYQLEKVSRVVERARE